MNLYSCHTHASHMFTHRPTQTCKLHRRVGKLNIPVGHSALPHPPSHLHTRLQCRASIRIALSCPPPPPFILHLSEMQGSDSQDGRTCTSHRADDKHLHYTENYMCYKCILIHGDGSFNASHAVCTTLTAHVACKHITGSSYGLIIPVRHVCQVKVKMNGEKRKADGYRGTICSIQVNVQECFSTKEMSPGKRVCMWQPSSWIWEIWGYFKVPHRCICHTSALTWMEQLVIPLQSMQIPTHGKKSYLSLIQRVFFLHFSIKFLCQPLLLRV